MEVKNNWYRTSIALHSSQWCSWYRNLRDRDRDLVKTSRPRPGLYQKFRD